MTDDPTAANPQSVGRLAAFRYRDFIGALKQSDLNYMSAMPAEILVEGTSEIRNWIVTAAAADRPGTMIEYSPLYRTTTGVGCAMGFANWDLN